jgi:hypothetical protein
MIPQLFVDPSNLQADWVKGKHIVLSVIDGAVSTCFYPTTLPKDFKMLGEMMEVMSQCIALYQSC